MDPDAPTRPQTLVLPLKVLRCIFWYMALLGPPSTTSPSRDGSHGWLAVLQVCIAWRNVALTDVALMAETYTHRPSQFRVTARLAGDEPLHYNTTVGCLIQRDNSSRTILRSLFDTTDFNYIGRLTLHSGADIQMHVVHLSRISRNRPLLHLKSMVIKSDTVPLIVTAEAADTWCVTFAYRTNIGANRRQVYDTAMVFMSHPRSSPKRRFFCERLGTTRFARLDQPSHRIRFGGERETKCRRHTV